MSIYDFTTSADMKTAGDIAAALNTDHELHEALRGPGVSLTDGAFDPNVERAFHRPAEDTPLVTSDDVVRLAEAEGIATETVGDALLPRATLYSLRGVRETLGLPAEAVTGATTPKPYKPTRPTDLDTLGLAAQHCVTDKDTIKALIAAGAVKDWSKPIEMTDQDGNVSTLAGKPMVSRSEVAAALKHSLGLGQ